MHTEYKIHCGTLVFRRSKGTDAQQLKNGCRVNLVTHREQTLVAEVLQKHGKYKHNDVVAAMLADDLDARARAARAKPATTKVVKTKNVSVEDLEVSQ